MLSIIIKNATFPVATSNLLVLLRVGTGSYKVSFQGRGKEMPILQEYGQQMEDVDMSGMTMVGRIEQPNNFLWNQ